MYISHTANPEQRVRSSEMSSFESCRFRSEMFMGRGKFEGRESCKLLGLWVLGFDDYHRGVPFRSFRLSGKNNQQLIIAMNCALTIVYSGFSHFCFWQCSESRFTGSLPVQDAPPINFLTSGLLGASSRSAGPSLPDEPAAEEWADLFGLGSLSELEKTMKLSSAAGVVEEDLLAP